MTTIFAETKPGHTFPPHISVSIADGQVRFIVRGPAKMVSHENGVYFEHGETGEIELSDVQAVELAEGILAHFEQRVLARETAAAEEAAQSHILAGLSDGRDRRPHPEFADAERAASFPETTVTGGDYLYEPFGEGSRRADLRDVDRICNGNRETDRGFYIGLGRDNGDHGDECDCAIHGHARVG